MAISWSDLLHAHKMQLAHYICNGVGHTPQNINRAIEILSTNPKKLQKAIKESGIEVGDLDKNKGEVDDGFEVQGEVIPDPFGLGARKSTEAEL